MVWLSFATVVVVVLLSSALLRFAPHPPLSSKDQEMGELPMTDLQKRSWLGLALGIVTLAAVIAMLSGGGIEHWRDDTALRLQVYALFLGGLVGLCVLLFVPVGRFGLAMDERDLWILGQGATIQAVVIIVWLFALSIWLTETYRDSGAIPIVYPTFIAMSSILVGLVGLAMGIVLGYRVPRIDG